MFPAPENDRQRYLGVLTHLFTHLLPRRTRINTWFCFVLHLQDDTQCVSSRNVIFYTLLLCAPVTRSRVPSQSPTVHASGIVFDASFGLNFQISAALGLIAGYGYRMSFAAQLTLSMLKLGLPVAVETNAERADNLQDFAASRVPSIFGVDFPASTVIKDLTTPPQKSGACQGNVIALLLGTLDTLRIIAFSCTLFPCQLQVQKS